MLYYFPLNEKKDITAITDEAESACFTPRICEWSRAEKLHFPAARNRIFLDLSLAGPA